MVQKAKYKKIFKKVILFYLIATFLLKRYKFEPSIKNQNKQSKFYGKKER